MGFSAVAFVLIFACSHHAFGNTCDEDAKCWSATQWLACREIYFGDIHTPEYLAALRSGHNIHRRTTDAAARTARH